MLTRFSLAVMVAAFCGAAAFGGAVDMSDRYSLAPAAHLTAAPIIDGVVDKAEWYDATLLPALVDHASALATPQRARVYVAYDGAKLYVAFQIDRSPNALVPAGGDVVELRLDAGHTHEAAAAYAGNVDGPVSGDGWEYAARATDFGWEGEMAVPLAAQVGDVCGFDFASRQATPVRSVASFSFGAKRGNAGQLNHLVMAPPRAPAVRFLQAGTFHSEDGGGASIELVNAGDSATQVKVEMALLRRAGGAETYLKAVTQIAGDDDIDIVMPLADMKQTVSEALAQYALAAAEFAEADQTVTVGADRRVDVRVVATDIGEYLCRYRIACGDTLLAAGLTPFRLAPPLQIAVTPYFLSPGGVEVQADLRQVAKWTQGAKLKFSITDDTGSIATDIVELAFDGRAQFVVVVPTDKLAPGGYQLAAEVIDAEGNAQGVVTEGFTKLAEPAWFTHPVGLEPAIPEPWKPIEAAPGRDTTKVSMLMGDYELADSVLPAKIGVASIFSDERKAVLRAPIRLHGTVDGKDVTFAGQVKIDEARGDLVRTSSSASQAGVRIDATGAFEYDGMEKITLDITPAPGSSDSPKVTRLTLSIPLTKGFADLYRPNRRLIDRKKTLPYSGTLPADGVSHDWRPNVWIGNTRRGLSWFCENWRGWRFNDDTGEHVIEVENKPEGATLHIHFIRLPDDAPLTLDKPRQIVFGLMFTPPRPIDRRPVRYGYSYFTPGETWGDRIDDERARGVNVLEVWNHPTYQGWPDETPELTQKLRTLGDRARKMGFRITPYSGWGISLKTAVYPKFGDEFVARPLTGIGLYCYAVCWNTPVTDAYLYQMRQTAIETGYDGFRMDAGFSVFPCNSLNHKHGDSACGWIDDDGNLQPSLSVFGAREAAKRSRRIYYHDKQVTTHPLLAHHIHGGCRFAPIMSHMDVLVSAEGMLQNVTNLDNFDISKLRGFVMEDKMGLQVAYHPKGDGIGYNTRLGLGALHRLTPRGGAIISRHEQSYSRSAFAVSSVWFAEDWVQWLDAGTAFFGYWENTQQLKTSDPAVLGSFHVRRGGKVMAALYNQKLATVRSDVWIDLASLGFGGAVYGADAMTHEPVAVSAGGEMSLTFGPESYRLIKIASQPFDFGPPLEKLSGNLAPELAAATWPDKGAPPGWAVYGDAAAWSVSGDDVVVDGTIDEMRQLLHQVKVESGKHYMMEVQVHCDADEGVYFGPSVSRDQFGICFGGYYGIKATTGHQTPAGEYVTLRRYYTAEQAQATARLWLQGNATAKIRSVGVYEINAIPRDGRGLDKGEIRAD